MQKISYAHHRFPPPIIQYAIWSYFKFSLSYRDVEYLLAERGIEVSYETVRCWVLNLGNLCRQAAQTASPTFGPVASQVMADGVDKLQNGYEITESFSSDLSGDAEAYYKIMEHSEKGFVISHTSTLGTIATREVQESDRVQSSTFMLG